MHQNSILMTANKNDILSNNSLYIINHLGEPCEVDFIRSYTKDEIVMYEFEIPYEYNKCTNFILTVDETVRSIYVSKCIYELN